MAIWFHSDPHFCHGNIIKYCNRPFADVKEMNRVMVERYNAVVDPSDTVYHLGDFAFGDIEKAEKIFRQLHGRKILILGNHDQSATRMRKIGFTEIYKQLTIEIGGRLVELSHYPYLAPNSPNSRWNAKRLKYAGRWLLHGHRHSTPDDCIRGNMIDVGVDAWNFTPVSLKTIQGIINAREICRIL